jgi:predicted Zn-dependent protease
VHTGLLARLENEDQLATVLGHEMTHVERRHMLRFERSSHNKEMGFNVLAVAASIAVEAAEEAASSQGHRGAAAAIDVFGGLIVDLGLGLAFVASVNGYGRSLETEADNGGFAKMTSAGYRLSEAPKVYEALADDHGEAKKVEAFFFGNHPHLKERIENAKHYYIPRTAAQAMDRKPIDPDLFARRIRPVVRDDARLNIELGRLKIAAAELQKALAWMPEDPLTQDNLGHLRLAQAASPDNEKNEAAQHRLRAEAGDAFRAAVRLGPDLPGVHLDLGNFLLAEKDDEHACRELQRFLEMVPEPSGHAEPSERSEDAASVENAESPERSDDTEPVRETVRHLKQEGHCG